MPVEIRELVIRADVCPDGDGGPGAVDVEAIIAACIREVLAVLRKSKER